MTGSSPIPVLPAGETRAAEALLARAWGELGPDWEHLTTAVLAGLIVARGARFAAALHTDGEWGTTTMRAPAPGVGVESHRPGR